MKKAARTVFSVLLVAIMGFSLLAFVASFVSPSQGRGRIEYRPVWEGIPDDVKLAYMENAGITILNYPENDTYFEQTLSRLPEISRGYVVLNLGKDFSIESLKGVRKTTRETLVEDLCDMMPVKTLPDCLLQANNQSV